MLSKEGHKLKATLGYIVSPYLQRSNDTLGTQLSYNPSIQGVEAGGSDIQGHAWVMLDFIASLKPTSYTRPCLHPESFFLCIFQRLLWEKAYTPRQHIVLNLVLVHA